MTNAPTFDPIAETSEMQALRREVRVFLEEQRAAGVWDPARPDPAGHNRAFSRAVGARGWIGMTWPRRYGGHERSFLERYVVTEEMLVAGAPVRSHFVADRQSGPVIMKYGAPDVCEDVLPRIVSGELSFCIGMSEPDSGSDLFAARSRAERDDGGWRLNGAKIWTSLAHQADYMIGIFRTSKPTEEQRRHGLTQFLVDMHAPGIAVRPILFPNREHEFNEVSFTDVFVPDDHVLGEVDMAWRQATSELAYERSGPERFLETFAVLRELVGLAHSSSDPRLAEGVGRMAAELHVLRQMSSSVSGMLEAGREPVLEASVVKEVGTRWEQELPSRARDLVSGSELAQGGRQAFDAVLDDAIATAPKFTIQGGTVEILRGIIARGLGLR